MHRKKTVIVLGNSISAHIAALYLQKQQPDLHVVIVGKHDPRLPLVGESLTEFSTQVLHDIGLGACLEEGHYHKYGLTFYFKEDIENPADRTYAVHEAVQIPSMPANLINRFTFDEELREVSRSRNIEIIEAKISDVHFDMTNGHTVAYRTLAGADGSITGRWIVDATGRSRVVAKKQNLEKTNIFPRCSFWFRLVDFDRAALYRFQAVKAKESDFDPYYVTHHFLGRGNWLWLIPVRTAEYKDMISIGIVWRPDLYPHTVNSMEKFQECVGQEHPVLNEFVASGKVIDTNLYSNYLYETSHVYSKDGWFLVGDAGDAVDPLYSTGLVMTAIQVTQVNAMIAADRSAQLTSAMVADLENAYKGLRHGIQAGVHTFYEVMHDPYQAHWRMHLISAYYFFFMLPSWLAGVMSEHRAARWFRTEAERGRDHYLSLLGLLAPGSKRLGRIPATMIPNRYDKTVDWTIRREANMNLARRLARLQFRFSWYRLVLLKNAGWQGLGMHSRHLVQQLARGVALMVVGWSRTLQNSRFIRRIVGLAWEDRVGEAGTVPLAPLAMTCCCHYCVARKGAMEGDGCAVCATEENNTVLEEAA